MTSLIGQMRNGTIIRSAWQINCNVPKPQATGIPIPLTNYTEIHCVGSEGEVAETTHKPSRTYNLTGTRGGIANAYLLPWQHNSLCWLTLGAAHDIFVTYSLNGCGVIVFGDRTNPTVIHGNENGTNIADFPGRCTVYDTFPARVRQSAHMAPGAGEAKWYPGVNYTGKGAVFGARVSGIWQIYGHDQSGGNSNTELIWPLDGAQLGNQGGCGRCYITTAVCLTLGLPDDCPELKTLRWFRNEVLEKTEEGKRDIAEYYTTAPHIVEAINRQSDSSSVYRRLYVETISPAVDAIASGDMQKAYELYRNMVNSLRHYLRR